MNLIFKAIVGSQSYGTATPQSDIDYKGIYMQPIDELITFKYTQQIELSKDECYWEVRRFLELLQTANPTVLELLYSPQDCIIQTSPQFEIIKKHKEKFLTQRCLHSFGGYAIAQIKKAKGLNKKLNWEKDKVTRKTPMDFIHVYDNGKTLPIKKWLIKNNLKQEQCGLVNLNHFKDCYALYKHETANYYKGIITDNSNSLRLSSIQKGLHPSAIIFYNKDGYSMHCRDYNDYIKWLAVRNTQRYVDIENHQQQIDGKNLLHCTRLIDTALEIATEKTINVRRPNADYLLSIRQGKVPLEEILENSERKIKELDDVFANSGLPKECDSEFVNDLLLQVRKYKKYYFF